MSDTFCSLLWNHIQLNATGSCKPCCRFGDARLYKQYGTNLNDAFHSDEANSIRKDMLEGKRIKGCEKCYRDEMSDNEIPEFSGKSMRTFNNEKFNVDINNPKIEYLELIPSNVCNFSCVMCNLTSSSEWYEDTIYLQNNNFMLKKDVERFNSNYLNLDGIDLSNLIELKLLGGEPFFEKENLKLLTKLKEYNRLSELTFHTHTNASFIPSKEWQSLLSEINKIDLSVSMEGYGKYNEYIRYGSKWETTFKVINFWHDFAKKHKNVTLKIHCVVSIYNLFHIEDFKWFLIEHGLCSTDASSVYTKPGYPKVILNFDVLNRPEYLSIINLPKEFKEQATKKITRDRYTEKILDALSQQGSSEMFEKFKTYTRLLEKKRKNSISSFDYVMEEMLYE